VLLHFFDRLALLTLYACQPMAVVVGVMNERFELGWLAPGVTGAKPVTPGVPKGATLNPGRFSLFTFLV
jgi:hypothetical protein